MKIIFEVDNTRYKEALVWGWQERYDEKLEPKNIKIGNNPSDIIMAVGNLDEEDIKNLEVVE